MSCLVRSAGDDVNDDKLMNLPSFLEAFSSIITHLSQVLFHALLMLAVFFFVAGLVYVC